MLTVLLASAVPVTVGVASFVVPAAVVIVGTVDAVASTMRLTGVEAVEVLPAASLAVAVKA